MVSRTREIYANLDIYVAVCRSVKWSKLTMNYLGNGMTAGSAVHEDRSLGLLKSKRSYSTK